MAGRGGQTAGYPSMCPGTGTGFLEWVRVRRPKQRHHPRRGLTGGQVPVHLAPGTLTADPGRPTTSRSSSRGSEPCSHRVICQSSGSFHHTFSPNSQDHKLPNNPDSLAKFQRCGWFLSSGNVRAICVCVSERGRRPALLCHVM